MTEVSLKGCTGVFAFGSNRYVHIVVCQERLKQQLAWQIHCFQ